MDTFSRESSHDDHEAVNRAHDYIINDMLRTELKMSPPLGGLDLLGASEWSLEKVVAWMNENRDRVPSACWSWSPDVSESAPKGTGIMRG